VAWAWARQADPEPTERPLLYFNDRDTLTLHQAFEGIFAIGGTGSGKSSTLNHLMLEFMERGAGMLFLTAKSDDYATIARLAREAGRETDLIRFAPGEQWRLDFLNYELSSPGGSVGTAAQFMQDLVDFSTRTNTMSNDEPFWPIAAARKIRMAMTVVYHAKGKCSIDDIYRFCTTMANTPEQLEKPEFANSFCFECIQEATAKNAHDPDLGLAGDYLLKEWPRLGDNRTGGCIDAYVMNLLTPFMHGSVRELVSSGVTNISPADLDAGKLIVVDLPLLKFRETGMYVQMVLKLLTQRYALRRTVTPESRPLVIWADEAQLHALPSVDSQVQSVARSHRLIQVAITQNIPLLESVLKRRQDVLAWVSNLQTWFMFANGDKDTNDLCSARCGQSKQLLTGSSISMAPADPIADWLGVERPQTSCSTNQHWLPDIRPEFWSGGQMRKGGSENNYIVDVVVHQTGRRFSNGKPWVKTSFKQMRQRTY
jgi:hypothetical protein